MRSLVLVATSVALFAFSPVAVAQPVLTDGDRADLRLVPGELVHPSLDFRLRDVGMVRDDEATAQHASSSARPSMHAWSLRDGDDAVTIVLGASDTPRAFSRDVLRATIDRLVSGGAVLSESSHERGVSIATLRAGPRTVVVRAFPFRDRGRGLVLAVTAIHLDGALARTIAMSLDVPPPVPAAVAESGLTRETIRSAIREWIPDVRYCYESALATRRDLAGRVTASFIIRATGTVQTTAISATTLNDAAVEGCIRDVIHAIRFPAPAGGGVVGVNYPFVLDTNPEPAAAP